MPMTADEIIVCIKRAIPDAVVEIQDLAGDGDHWSAVVHSSAFRGKNRVQQHKMVTNAINQNPKNTLHALQLKTKAL